MNGLITNLQISTHSRRCVEDYLTSLGISPENFHGKIADQDEMFHKAIAVKHPVDFAYFKYIESGRRTHDVMEQFYQHYFGGPHQIGSVLEFASGHGRATRFMIQSIPADRVWVSDIYSDAMSFQESYLKVNTIQSVEHPDKFECDRKFDLITAMSLFTHLPEDIFGKWLAKLGSLLEKDGVLVVTAREAETVTGTRNIDGIEERGIVYELRSESSSLSTDIYGLTTVTDEFMRRMIAEFISPKANIQVFRRGLYLNQDVYAISLRDPVAFTPLDLKRPPTGGRAPQWISVNSGREFQIFGWVVDMNVGHEIVAVDVYIDNVRFGQAEFHPYRNTDFAKHFPGFENEPKSWSVRLPADLLRPESIVKFRVKCDTGASIEYYAPPADLLHTAS